MRVKVKYPPVAEKIENLSHEAVNIYVCQIDNFEKKRDKKIFLNERKKNFILNNSKS